MIGSIIIWIIFGGFFGILFIFLIINLISETLGYHKSSEKLNIPNDFKKAVKNFKDEILMAQNYFYMVTGGNEKFFQVIKDELFKVAKEGKVKIIIVTERMNSILEELKDKRLIEIYKIDFEPQFHYRIIDDYYVKIESKHDDEYWDGKVSSFFKNNRFMVGLFLNEFNNYLKFEKIKRVA